MRNEAFAHDLRATVAKHLAPAEVFFRGSFAEGAYDAFSDIDLQANVECALDNAFYAALEEALREAYGPALVRFDPDFAGNTMAQSVRVSFYDMPIFWRLDLTVASKRDPGKKYPDPFPEWADGTSALMNIVWALKYHKRGRHKDADALLACACEKAALPSISYAPGEVLAIIDRLRERPDTDTVLAGKLAACVECETTPEQDCGRCVALSRR